MPWFRKTPQSKAYLHYIEPHKNKRGHMTKPRWHVDIVDMDGKLLFVCPPRGFPSLDEARNAVEKLEHLEVVVGRRPKPATS